MLSALSVVLTGVVDVLERSVASDERVAFDSILTPTDSREIRDFVLRYQLSNYSERRSSINQNDLLQIKVGSLYQTF